MPSAPQPDNAGEVVEVFSGDTLEAAMASAVASLGPDLAVRRARKLRKGVVGRDRYEVVAAAGLSASGGSTDAVRSAFDALLEEADANEQVRTPPARRGSIGTLAPRPASPPAVTGRGRRSAAPTLTPVPSLPPEATKTGRPARRLRSARSTAAPAPSAVAVIAAARATGRTRRTTRTTRAAAPTPAPTPVPTAVPTPPTPARTPARTAARTPARTPRRTPATPRRTTTTTSPTAPATPASRAAATTRTGRATPATPATTATRVTPARPRRRTAPTAIATVGWSRQALTSLGLPAVLLQALPAQDPTGDLAWVVGLSEALAELLPAPAEPDEEHPVVVSGYGLAGLLAIVEAGCRGVTPGTWTWGSRTCLATPTELALGVRALLGG